MAFDPVPWAVGGGAEHSVNVARNDSFVGARGNEGIVGPTSWQVRELNVPGTSVRVSSGVGLILNRTAGYSSEMYTARSGEETQLAIAATGSGSGRSDLVVVRIEDPYLNGSQWQVPVDPTVGPYVNPVVISGVPDTTTAVADLGLGYSAIALARIDIPASTGTITQSMITDLRQVANPRRNRELFTYAMVEGETEQGITTIAAGEYFPNLARWDLRIPEWATEMHIVAQMVGARATADQVYGRLWVGIGDIGQTSPNALTTQEIRFDTPFGSGVTRQTFIAADNVSIPSSIRGQVRRFGIRARKDGGDGNVTVDWGSAVTLDIEFREAPATEQVV